MDQVLSSAAGQAGAEEAAAARDGARRARIGLVGYGAIGSYVYEQIAAHPEWAMEIAFVCDPASSRLKELPAHVVLEKLGDFASRKPDLIVEMAHPQVTRDYGEAFLRCADYMPLSLTALADPRLEESLPETARRSGACLYIPHGAMVGLESLYECRDMWQEVEVVMRKNPKNLDFAAVAARFRPEEIRAPAVLYEGSTRGICPLFPRNVNSHAAAALAGIGFERTRSVLVADPSLEASVIELSARGAGTQLTVARSNPLKGVSGVFTLRSILSGICRAKASGASLQIC